MAALGWLLNLGFAASEGASAAATPEPTGDGGGGGEYRGRRRRPEASRKSTGGAYGPVFEEPPARVTRKSPVRPLAGSTSSREHLAALRERARELEAVQGKSEALRRTLAQIELQVAEIEQRASDDEALLLLLVAME